MKELVIDLDFMIGRTYHQLPLTEVGGLQLASVVQANSPRGVLP